MIMVAVFWTMNISAKPGINTANMKRMSAMVQFTTHFVRTNRILANEASTILFREAEYLPFQSQPRLH
jgi:hypothetical protein